MFDLVVDAAEVWPTASLDVSITVGSEVCKLKIMLFFRLCLMPAVTFWFLFSPCFGNTSVFEKIRDNFWRVGMSTGGGLLCSRLPIKVCQQCHSRSETQWTTNQSCRAVHVHLSVLERGHSLCGVAGMWTMRVFQWSEAHSAAYPLAISGCLPRFFLSYRNIRRDGRKSWKYF